MHTCPMAKICYIQNDTEFCYYCQSYEVVWVHIRSHSIYMLLPCWVCITCFCPGIINHRIARTRKMECHQVRGTMEAHPEKKLFVWIYWINVMKKLQQQYLDRLQLFVRILFVGWYSLDVFTVHHSTAGVYEYCRKNEENRSTRRNTSDSRWKKKLLIIRRGKRSNRKIGGCRSTGTDVQATLFLLNFFSQPASQSKSTPRYQNCMGVRDG